MTIEGSALSVFHQYEAALMKASPLVEIERIITQPSFEVNKLFDKKFKGVITWPRGRTPLLMAIFVGRGDVVKKLLSLGAKVLIEGATKNPLDRAILNGHFDIASTLLRHSKADEALYLHLIQLLFQLIKNEEDKEKVKKNGQIDVALLINQLKKDYSINIMQGKIIPKFIEWLLHQKEKSDKYPHLEEFIEKYFSSRGYCNALTWLFLYEIAKTFRNKGKVDLNELPLLQDLRLISESGESELESGSVDPAYEGILRELTILHHPYLFLDEYHQSDFVENISDYSVVKQFRFSELMEVGEIIEFLPEVIPYATMIRLSSDDHIIGSMKLPSAEGEKFIIYESNDAGGPKSFSTIKDWAEYIKNALSEKDPKIQFCMNQYTLLNKDQRDIKQEKENAVKADVKALELLEKIYKARLAKYESEIKEYESKLKVYHAEKAKGVKDLIMPALPIHPFKIRSKNGHSALYLACHEGNLPFVKWYLEKHIDIIDLNEGLWIAAQNGYEEIVETLLLNGANYNYIHTINESAATTPLLQAARIGRLEVCKKIISHVEKLNAGDPMNVRLKKLLHPAALELACKHNHPEVIDLLIQKGVDPNCKFNGYTVLGNAIKRNQPDVVRTLLKYTRKNLERYREAHSEDIDANKALLNFPLKRAVIIQDDPLMREVFFDDAVDLLLEAAMANQAVIVEELVKAGANPNFSLNAAIMKGDRTAVKLLARHGATAAPENLFGFYVLMGDHVKANELIKPGMDKVSCIKLLLFAIKVKDDKTATVLLKMINADDLYRLEDKLEKMAVDTTSVDLAKILIDKNMTTVRSLWVLFEKELDFSSSSSRRFLSFLITRNPNASFENAIRSKNLALIEFISKEFAEKIDLGYWSEYVKEMQKTGDNSSLISNIIKFIEKDNEKEKVLADLAQEPPPMIIRKPGPSSSSPQEVKQEIADIMEVWTDLKDYARIIKEEMTSIRDEQLRNAMSQLVKTIESYEDSPSSDELSNEILPRVKELSTESGVPQSIQMVLNAMLKLEGTKIVSISGKATLKSP